MASPLPRLNQPEVLTHPVGGSQASDNLGGLGEAYRGLADFASSVQDTVQTVGKPYAESAGAASVSKDPDTGQIKVDKSGWMAYGPLSAAYDHGSAVAFAAQSETDQHAALGDLAAKSPTDPDKFLAGANAWLKTQAKGAPPKLRADLMLTGTRLIGQYRNGIAEKKTQVDQERFVDQTTTLIDQKEDEYVQLVAQPGGADTPEAHQIHQEIANLWKSLSDNPLTKVSQAHAQSEIGKLQGKAISEALLRQLDGGTVGLATVEAALKDPYFGGAAPQPPNFDTTKAAGMMAAGNVDPWSRPVLHNADGSYSTTSSISIGTDKGEVLIPTVIDGKRLSQADAIAHFKTTGENLGTFDTPEHADAYSTALHDAQASMFDERGNPKGGSVFTTAERLALINRAEAIVTDKETKRRAAEAQVNRDAAKVSDEFLKTARDLKAGGRLTVDWIQKNRAQMNAADYGVAYGLLTSEGVEHNDPGVYADLVLAKANTPVPEYRDMIAKAVRRGSLKPDTANSLLDQNATAFRDDHPASPYRQGRAFVSNSLDANPFGTGPDFGAKKQAQANALTEYDAWAQAHPQATADEALGVGTAIVQRYSLLGDAITPGAIGSPYGFAGSLNAVTTDDVQRAAQRLKTAYAIGSLSDAQYQAEVARLGAWNRNLAKKAQNKPKAP